MHRRSELDLVYFYFLSVVLVFPSSLTCGEHCLVFVWPEALPCLLEILAHSPLGKCFPSALWVRETRVTTQPCPAWLRVVNMTQSANQNSPMELILPLLEKEVLFSLDFTKVIWGEPELLQTVLSYLRSALLLSVW